MILNKISKYLGAYIEQMDDFLNIKLENNIECIAKINTLISEIKTLNSQDYCNSIKIKSGYEPLICDELRNLYIISFNLKILFNEPNKFVSRLRIYNISKQDILIKKIIQIVRIFNVNNKNIISDYDIDILIDLYFNIIKLIYGTNHLFNDLNFENRNIFIASWECIIYSIDNVDYKNELISFYGSKFEDFVSLSKIKI